MFFTCILVLHFILLSLSLPLWLGSSNYRNLACFLWSKEWTFFINPWFMILQFTTQTHLSWNLCIVSNIFPCTTDAPTILQHHQNCKTVWEINLILFFNFHYNWVIYNIPFHTRLLHSVFTSYICPHFCNYQIGWNSCPSRGDQSVSLPIRGSPHDVRMFWCWNTVFLTITPIDVTNFTALTSLPLLV